VCFNSDREVIHRQVIGPWTGTFAWVEQHQRIKVPGATRLASVEFGLWGGTGEVSVAQVTLTVIAGKPRAGAKNSLQKRQTAVSICS
jgi:hypothetical protein